MSGHVSAVPTLLTAFRGHESRGSESNFQVETSCGSVSVRQSQGCGLPVLLIHDAAGDLSSFDCLFKGALALRHRLIALELPGHGWSSVSFNPSTPYTALSFADMAIEVAESLGVDRAAVVGSGSGAEIAIRVAASWPAVRAVCLIGTELFIRLDSSPESSPKIYKCDVIQNIRDPITNFSIVESNDTYLRDIIDSKIPVTSIVGPNNLELFDYRAAFTDMLGVCPNAFHLTPCLGHSPLVYASVEVEHLMSCFLQDIENDELAERTWLSPCG